MCFAPQRRALFRHLNFQKWSEVFCAFWLGNVLRATTACNFSSLIWPAGSAPATKPRKNTVNRNLSYLFAHLHLLSSDLFSSDSSPCWLLFHLSILSEVWLPNFLRSDGFRWSDVGPAHRPCSFRGEAAPLALWASIRENRTAVKPLYASMAGHDPASGKNWTSKPKQQVKLSLNKMCAREPYLHVVFI